MTSLASRWKQDTSYDVPGRYAQFVAEIAGQNPIVLVSFDEQFTESSGIVEFPIERQVDGDSGKA